MFSSKFAPWTLPGLSLLLLISTVVADQTWWVDDSCKGKFKDGVFDKMMEEVIETSKLARDRMSRTREQEPQAHAAFEHVFKYKADSADKDDKALFEYFKDAEITKSTAISEFKKESASGDAGRKASEIRIYCDEDARFTLVPDNEELWDKHSLPVNSKRHIDKQEWDDLTNKIRHQGMPSCKENKVITNWGTQMVTYGSTGSNIGSNSDEQQWRTTITICSFWLDAKGRYEMVSQIPKTRQFGIIGKKTMKPIDALGEIGSMIMYHEFHHHMRYQTTDHAYKWKDCYALDKDKASSNADSYEIFGILLWALERKFALDPKKVADGKWGSKDESIPDRVKLSKRELATRQIFCKDEAQHGGEAGLVCKDFEA
ncbi:hypothetical protein EJ04DRAFT_570078 [Polyplosphaeria fusca]|uniref:Uncharacterized protein n=1 Tax=Polyplosphaeria fusca TaxID=682080 RepID=A0A9P4QJT2_9PLEO|nr:hypothetical protein EJ04DRAFT_570078 [Polyplosphaeria fusca]